MAAALCARSIAEHGQLLFHRPAPPTRYSANDDIASEREAQIVGATAAISAHNETVINLSAEKHIITQIWQLVVEEGAKRDAYLVAKGRVDMESQANSCFLKPGF